MFGRYRRSRSGATQALVRRGVRRGVAVAVVAVGGHEDLHVLLDVDGLVGGVGDLLVDRVVVVVVAAELGLVIGLVDDGRDRDGLGDVVAAVVAVVVGLGAGGRERHGAGGDESGGGGRENGLGEHGRGPLFRG